MDAWSDFQNGSYEIIMTPKRFVFILEWYFYLDYSRKIDYNERIVGNVVTDLSDNAEECDIICMNYSGIY